MKRSVAYLKKYALLFLITALACLTVFLDMPISGISAAVLLIAAAAVNVVMIMGELSEKRRAALAVKAAAGEIDRYNQPFLIPMAVCGEKNRVLWYNTAFFELFSLADRAAFASLLPAADDAAERTINISGTGYRVESISAGDETIYLLIDPEKFSRTDKTARAALPAVCQIRADNYSELLSRIPQSYRSQLTYALDETVSKWSAGLGAALFNTAEGCYTLIFERKHLATLRSNRFKVLDDVRAIKTPSGVGPTVSIAVGVGDGCDQSAAFAYEGIELANARGGDQAVVKDAHGLLYFGGTQKAVEIQTKVRSRYIARALKSLMEQYDDVVIMGHSVPDLDCIGSALGLLACARWLKKPAHIVVGRKNDAIALLLERLEDDPAYANVIITPQEAASRVGKRTMLIVVDTQSPSYTIAPKLLTLTHSIVVIDHHLRGSEYIDDTILMYHEPYASSTAEMVTELAQFFGERVELRPVETEALLAGIIIDTKGFSFKTRVRTFEAAAYLQQAGANTTSVRRLFQDDMQTFKNRTAVVSAAEVEDSVAYSVCPKDAANPELLAAQAADSLLGIRGIAASFVLCETAVGAVISGRSLGGINVQSILEKLGGGGHATIAGAQLPGKTTDEALALLREAVRKSLHPKDD